MRLQQGVSVRTFIRWLFAGTVHPSVFPAFCINPVDHLEVRRRTVVCQRFVIDKNVVE